MSFGNIESNKDFKVVDSCNHSYNILTFEVDVKNRRTLKLPICYETVLLLSSRVINGSVP